MKLSQSRQGYGLGIVSLLQPHYGSWKTRDDRQELLIEFAKRGASFIRFGAMPGFFEAERDQAKFRKLYNFLFPLQYVTADPRINEDWRISFRELLEDLKLANLMPVVYLIGGCDFHKPLNPNDNTHKLALTLYYQSVIRELKNCGQDYLIETGNEIYGLFGTGEDGARSQASMIKELLNLGAPLNRVMVAGMDKYWMQSPSLTEWLQKHLFDPAVNYRGNEYKYNVGFSQHEVSSPEDFGNSGGPEPSKKWIMHRAQVNNWANAKQGDYNNLFVSTDGAAHEGGKYKGVPTEDIGPLYKRFLEVTAPEQIGTCHFEHLPNEAIKWENGIAHLELGKETFDRLDAMAEVYKVRFGKYPINKIRPPKLPEPSPPKPAPLPPVPEPKPEEPKEVPVVENKLKLFRGFKKTFPFIDLDFKGWWKTRSWKERFSDIYKIIVHLLALWGLKCIFL